MASLNILTAKGEKGPAPAFSLEDLLDPKIWLMVAVCIGAVWFTTRKTSEIQKQRSKREQEVYDSRNKQKKSINELSKRLDDMNKRFSNFK